jgi:hypothetical protein
MTASALLLVGCGGGQTWGKQVDQGDAMRTSEQVQL